jgi:hypothetical protein
MFLPEQSAYMLMHSSLIRQSITFTPECSSTCSADSRAGARITARQASPINPFAGTVFYVNPDYAKNAATSLARVAANSTDAARIRAIQVRSHLQVELQHSTAWQGRPAFIVDEWPATCRVLRQLCCQHGSSISALQPAGHPMLVTSCSTSRLPTAS